MYFLMFKKKKEIDSLKKRERPTNRFTPSSPVTSVVFLFVWLFVFSPNSSSYCYFLCHTFPFCFILNPFTEHSFPSYLHWYPALHQGYCLSFCIFLCLHTVGAAEGRNQHFFPIPLPVTPTPPIIRLHLHYFWVYTRSVVLFSFSCWLLSFICSSAKWQ